MTLAQGTDRRSRLRGALLLCHLNTFVWVAPAAIYLFFPLTFPVPVNWFKVLPVIALTIAIPYLAARLGGKLDLRHRHRSESAAFGRIGQIAAIASPIFLFVDLFVFRGLVFAGDIEANRELYSGTAPSIVGYISLFGLAASQYLLTKTGPEFKWWMLLPWLANVFIFLISGNRQYALMGFFLLFFSSIIIRRSRLTALDFIKFAGLNLLLATVALLFQFLRQSSTDGRQTEFLYTISGIECQEWFCDSLLEAPVVYIYAYFGNIYSGLTIALSDLTTAPILSLTLPVVFRRLSSLMDAPQQDIIMANIANSIQTKYDIFPNFWSTMFAAAYLETNWLGVAVLLLAILVALTYVFALWIGFGGSRYQSVACIAVAFLATGIMYFPLSEPVNFILFLLLCGSLLFSPKINSVKRHLVSPELV